MIASFAFHETFFDSHKQSTAGPCFRFCKVLVITESDFQDNQTKQKMSKLQRFHVAQLKCPLIISFS